jgi:thiol:disulfide interchange protein DsbC
MREANITIYTFLYPILRADSPDKSRAIWCAPDRAKAYYDLMLNGREPALVTNCGAPVEKWLALGQKLGIKATPTSFTAGGQRVLGARTEDLVKLISESAK